MAIDGGKLKQCEIHRELERETDVTLTIEIAVQHREHRTGTKKPATHSKENSADHALVARERHVVHPVEDQTGPSWTTGHPPKKCEHVIFFSQKSRRCFFLQKDPSHCTLLHRSKLRMLHYQQFYECCIFFKMLLDFQSMLLFFAEITICRKCGKFHIDVLVMP